MKRLAILTLTFSILCSFIRAQERDSWSQLEGKINLFVANDLGRNGYYDQRTIAAMMGEMAEELSIESVVAAGDVHHFDGVVSTDDPLWMTNYELIYDHPELMIEWLPAFGNHEYRGNTKAVMDYSKVSRRWEMEDRYYTRTYEEDGVTLRLVVIDTTPLIDKYREEGEKYPDAHKQKIGRQLKWLDKTLAKANEDWVIVVGHHPIYAQTSKAESERKNLQERLDPILRRHEVDLYVAGHIHNFQHIRIAGSPTEYVVNSSASLSRNVKPIEGTCFCSPETGFSLIAADKEQLSLHMINKEGRVLHTVTRKK